MELSFATYGIAAALIFVVSFIFAMLGMGGGMLYVPIFKWLEFPVKTVAIPIGLLLNALNTLLAFIRYAREGLVDFRGGMPAAVAALVLAPVGAWSVQFVSQDTLLLLFAIAVVVAGVRTLITSGRSEPRQKISMKKRMLIGGIVGGFAGFIGGLLGLGGGFIIGPMLMEMGYPTKEAAATTAFIVTFSSFSGFFGHMAEGHIDPVLAVVTVVSVIVGSQLGAWYMAKKAHPDWVKKLYGIVLLGVAAKLLHGIFSE